jgi:hypothetical protein
MGLPKTLSNTNFCPSWCGYVRTSPYPYFLREILIYFENQRRRVIIIIILDGLSFLMQLLKA